MFLNLMPRERPDDARLAVLVEVEDRHVTTVGELLERRAEPRAPNAVHDRVHCPLRIEECDIPGASSKGVVGAAREDPGDNHRRNRRDQREGEWKPEPHPDADGMRAEAEEVRAERAGGHGGKYGPRSRVAAKRRKNAQRILRQLLVVAECRWAMLVWRWPSISSPALSIRRTLRCSMRCARPDSTPDLPCRPTSAQRTPATWSWDGWTSHRRSKASSQGCGSSAGRRHEGFTSSTSPERCSRRTNKLMTAIPAPPAAGVPHPRTAHVDGRSLPPTLTPPFVVKPRFGSWGPTCTAARTPSSSPRASPRSQDGPWFERQGVLVQELVPACGYDLRIIVAAGRWSARSSGSPPTGNGARTSHSGVGAGRQIRRWRPASSPCPRPPRWAVDLVGVDLLPDGQGGWTVLEINGAVDFTAEYSARGRRRLRGGRRGARAGAPARGNCLFRQPPQRIPYRLPE